jgi:hypothetical protein
MSAEDRGGRLGERTSSTQPAPAGLVLISLIAVTAVANLNLNRYGRKLMLILGMALSVPA